MTVYKKFDELVTKHNIEVLDNSEWCKVFFRKAGLNEDNLEVSLFFMLLDKNVALEIRKATFKKNLYTDYKIAIAVYAKLFDTLMVPNLQEEILIRHIIGIINVLKKRCIIDFEYLPELRETELITELGEAVTKMLELYSIGILSDSEKIEGFLRDISGNRIEDFEIQSFLFFLTVLNSENICFSNSNKRNLYFFKIMDNALNSADCIYEPMEKQRRHFMEQNRGV